jgi:hypothetical protein
LTSRLSLLSTTFVVNLTIPIHTVPDHRTIHPVQRLLSCKPFKPGPATLLGYVPKRRCAQDQNCAGMTRPRFSSLYWNQRRSDKGFQNSPVPMVPVVPNVQPLRSVQIVQVVQSLCSAQNVTRLRLTFVQGFKVQAFNDRLGRELPGFRNSGNEGMDAGYRLP